MIGIIILRINAKVNRRLSLIGISERTDPAMKIYSYNGKCNLSGENVRIAREAKRLSQEQLAAKMQLEGVQLSQKAISRIETGERVVADYELLILSRVLGVSVAALLSQGDTL